MLIISKLFDVLTTLKNISGISDETNPYARWLMQKLGIKSTVWLVFLVALVIILLATELAFSYGPIMQVAFILLGTAIASIQCAVAHHNLTGRDNFITRRARRIFRRI